jgi:hypothetical protein
MRFAILSALGLASITTADSTPLQKLNAITDFYIFNSTIEEFMTSYYAQPQPEGGGLDWTVDGCSSFDEDPLGYNCTSRVTSSLPSTY